MDLLAKSLLGWEDESLKLAIKEFVGHWGDALRCIEITSEGEVNLLASVYRGTSISQSSIRVENDTLYFDEVNEKDTTLTNWELNVCSMQIVLCPANHSHNMVLLTLSQEEPHYSSSGVPGWTCDICSVNSNDSKKTKSSTLSTGRYFCPECMTDVCRRCAGARKQYDRTLSGTATSTSTSMESLSHIPLQEVSAYSDALREHHDEVALQLRIDGEQRQRKQKDAYGIVPPKAPVTSTSTKKKKEPRKSDNRKGKGNFERVRPMARMLLASSGRDNFVDLSIPSSLLSTAEPRDRSLCTSRSAMIAMLTLEADLRNGSSAQRLLCDMPEYGEAIFSSLQDSAARLVGFQNPMLGRAAIRAAATLFPNDNELLHIAPYRKYNRSAVCSLNLGDPFPDLSVFELDANHGQDSCPSQLLLSEYHRKLLDISKMPLATVGS
mmetsp:Transcript_8710/g.14786  ORF Transcript_8710/g.14786 Transcript_8710/m.14786 type:complete len:437 (+) Transcript_8710:148-1458(+)|eukprot:CAMPEP_0114430352 /NCGR_PEP_ID=MMETSP0103-20121206/9996_1 /TAXON_ID=37642 ORGANISM="Paraphysomonas imperforata, Strain PA2" /NCGR_SAMPLE_ID=MMETSP0103 /ASSEMBLY_ACC=CAM_ASM_000201 /LENGTH=436 /DNA_ID=CAMNT_0001599795 /DNA_START=141 /DNA_END=1451 /DNA_ORIENTATION=+